MSHFSERLTIFEQQTFFCTTVDDIPGKWLIQRNLTIHQAVRVEGNLLCRPLPCSKFMRLDKEASKPPVTPGQQGLQISIPEALHLNADIGETAEGGPGDSEPFAPETSAPPCRTIGKEYTAWG